MVKKNKIYGYAELSGFTIPEVIKMQSNFYPTANYEAFLVRPRLASVIQLEIKDKEKIKIEYEVKKNAYSQFGIKSRLKQDIVISIEVEKFRPNIVSNKLQSRFFVDSKLSNRVNFTVKEPVVEKKPIETIDEKLGLDGIVTDITLNHIVTNIKEPRINYKIPNKHGISVKVENKVYEPGEISQSYIATKINDISIEIINTSNIITFNREKYQDEISETVRDDWYTNKTINVALKLSDTISNKPEDNLTIKASKISGFKILNSKTISVTDRLSSTLSVVNDLESKSLDVSESIGSELGVIGTGSNINKNSIGEQFNSILEKV